MKVLVRCTFLRLSHFTNDIDTREVTRPAGKVEKNKIHYFLKCLNDHKEMIYENKKNNEKKEYCNNRNKVFPRNACLNKQNIIIRGYSQNGKRINVVTMKNRDYGNHHDENDSNGQSNGDNGGGEKSHIFIQLGENVTMGKGNILFPGSKIIAPFGKVHIGNYNLLEDHVEIVNNTTNDMYIGNYNIFRSGTYITNTLYIGNRNYFDYKCVISNSNVSCCSFVGTNLMICSSWGNKENVQTSYNTVTDMHPIFVEHEGRNLFTKLQ
ncbi:dynactin subunit 6, putative [Plasmodium ovale curtisi]|uniref:Dynactin subunit 6 n=2 Tax=Plasmodium ovale curtisi TaxID=864141 RepID=A0A1A8VLI4_PLAOA|nr:dynactin subunit 6, putative [Plasmodium ovale curtisi]